MLVGASGRGCARAGYAHRAPEEEEAGAGTCAEEAGGARAFYGGDLSLGKGKCAAPHSASIRFAAGCDTWEEGAGRVPRRAWENVGERGVVYVRRTREAMCVEALETEAQGC